MNNSKITISIIINRQINFKKFFATILLFSFILQSCGVNDTIQESHEKPTINQIIDIYVTELSPEYRESFKKEIAPVLKEKLNTVKNKEKQRAIFNKIVDQGIVSPQVITSYFPNQWVKKTLKLKLLQKNYLLLENSHQNIITSIHRCLYSIENKFTTLEAEQIFEFSAQIKSENLYDSLFFIENSAPQESIEILKYGCKKDFYSLEEKLKLNWIDKNHKLNFEFDDLDSDDFHQKVIVQMLVKSHWTHKQIMFLLEPSRYFTNLDPYKFSDFLEFLHSYKLPFESFCNLANQNIDSNELIDFDKTYFQIIFEDAKKIFNIADVDKQNNRLAQNLEYLCKTEANYICVRERLENKKYICNTLNLIREYVCTKEESIIKSLDSFSSFYKKKEYNQAHQVIIEHTFGPDKELELDEIIKIIAKKSPNTYFVKDENLLTKSYKDIENRYNSKSKNSRMSKVEINCWSQETIGKWSQKVRTGSFCPSQEEIISVVVQTAKLHNGFLPRKTQILSIISLLNKENQKGRLAQINTGEGKSLIVAMFAAIKALEGQEVDVITTSTELSMPEVNKQRAFFRTLGLTVSDNSEYTKSKNADRKLILDKERKEKMDRESQKEGAIYQEEEVEDLCEDGYTKLNVYANDIVYGTSGDFQGDILRTEFMKLGTRGKRQFGTIVIDEVDSMFFDNRTQSIKLSGLTPAMNHLEIVLAATWSQVTKFARHTVTMRNGKYFYVPEDFQADGLDNISLFSGKDPNKAGVIIDDNAKYIEYITKNTEEFLRNALRNLWGQEYTDYQQYTQLLEDQAFASEHIEKNIVTNESQDYWNRECEYLEARLKTCNWHRHHPYIYIPQHLREFARLQIPSWVDSAIKALFTYKREVDYDIVDGKIIPIDHRNTGVLQMNMVWSNGLAQMLQLKEGVPLQPESISTNSLGSASFFKRYGKNIYGLSGTLGNGVTQRFFEEIYNTDAVVIPPYKNRDIANNEHSSYICKELPAIISPTENEWYQEIIDTILDKTLNNRAVLIICKYIRQVKTIAQKLRSQPGNHKIFEYTGQTSFHKDKIDIGEVIVATNIAGRGTDITTSPAVEKTGGLHVCITFLPETLRVELQNAGRTARQGKKGTAQLIIHDENNYSIDVLKTSRELQEEKAIESAIKDVKNIIFKDLLFSKFCSLEDEVIPEEKEQKKVRQSYRLNELWRLFQAYELSQSKMQLQYDSQIKALALERFNEIINIDLANPTVVERESIKNHISTNREKYLKQLEDTKRIEQPFSEFYRKGKQEVLNNFCDKQKSLYPSDVIEALREGRCYTPKNAHLSEGRNWDDCELLGIEERWGLWFMANVKETGDVDENLLLSKFIDFANHIRNNAASDDLIRNPYFYVWKGNCRPAETERGVTTDDCYVRAINLDPRYSANALYNRAQYFLQGETKKSNLENALQFLKKAKLLIRTYYKTELLSLNVFAGDTNSKPQFVKHINHQMNILFKQESYIDSAMENIKVALDKEWDVKLDYVSMKEEFETADENHDMAIQKAQVNGLYNFFKVTPVEPTNWWGIAGVALLGLLQVAVGVILMIQTGGAYGSSFISEGISDIVTSVKSAIGGGKFSWKDWGIQKAISIAVSLICAGWDAIKGGFNALKNAVKSIGNNVATETTKIITKEGLKEATKQVAISLGKSVMKECVSVGIEYVAEKTVGVEIEKEIEKQVTSQILSSLEKNPLIQKALASDIKHKTNFWQEKITQEGLELLQESQSGLKTFFYGVGRGVSSNLIKDASAFFKLKDAAVALDNVKNYTNIFLTQLVNKIDSTHKEEIIATYNTPVENRTERQIDPKEVIHRMEEGSYHRTDYVDNDKISESGYHTKSDHKKIGAKFISIITKKLNVGVQNSITNSMIRNGVSYGVDYVMDSAAKTIQKTRSDLQGEGKTYHIPDFFPEAFAKKEEEKKDTLEERLFAEKKVEIQGSSLLSFFETKGTESLDLSRCLQKSICEFKSQTQNLITAPSICIQTLENKIVEEERAKENKAKENYLSAQKHMRQKTLEAAVLNDYKEKKLIEAFATKPPKGEREIIKDLFKGEDKKSPQEVANRTQIQSLLNQIQQTYSEELELKKSCTFLDSQRKKNLENHKIDLLKQLENCNAGRFNQIDLGNKNSSNLVKQFQKPQIQEPKYKVEENIINPLKPLLKEDLKKEKTLLEHLDLRKQEKEARIEQKVLEMYSSKDNVEEHIFKKMGCNSMRDEKKIVSDLLNLESTKSKEERNYRKNVQSILCQLQSVYSKESLFKGSKNPLDLEIQKDLQNAKTKLLKQLDKCEGWGKAENEGEIENKNNRTKKLDSLHEILEKEKKLEEDLKVLEKKFELEEELKLNKQKTSIIDPLIQEWYAVKDEKEKLLENLKFTLVEKVELGLLEECKVAPEEISRMAKKTVEDISNRYGKIDAACNIGVYTMIEKLTGNTGMYNTETKAPMVANRMYDHLGKSKDWEEIKGHQGLQALANDGYIVVAVWKNPVENGHGHVTMIVPGKEYYSGNWKSMVPCTFDTGANMRASSQKLSESFGKKKMNDVKYYVFKHKKL